MHLQTHILHGTETEPFWQNDISCLLVLWDWWPRSILQQKNASILLKSFAAKRNLLRKSSGEEILINGCIFVSESKSSLNLSQRKSLNPRPRSVYGRVGELIRFGAKSIRFFLPPPIKRRFTLNSKITADRWKWYHFAMNAPPLYRLRSSRKSSGEWFIVPSGHWCPVAQPIQEKRHQ